MQILEWALRENLAPHTSNEDNFTNNLDEITKYAELVAAYGQILQLEGMTDADDETYAQFAAAMLSAAKETLKAVKNKDPDLARSAVAKLDQSCNKCHETYR
jgi:cytochrome c556